MAKATLEQWRMFKAVVEHGGFAGASTAVNKSQSTVHHAVQKLEAVLQIKLLEVKGRKAFLTDAGTLILRRAEFLIEEANKIESIADTLNEGIESTLKIAIDDIFPDALLYSALAQMSTLYPQVKIELIKNNVNKTNQLLSNSVVDLAISTSPICGINCSPLCDVEFVAVAHADHPLHNQGEQLSSRHLKSHRKIIVHSPATGTNYNNHCVNTEMCWSISHYQNAIDLVSQLFGYAWLPLSKIAHLLENKTLKVLNLEHATKHTINLYLMCNDSDRLGPAAQKFKEQLVALTNPVNN